jgi:type II secretory pathway predicted ATPase ExeA
MNEREILSWFDLEGQPFGKEIKTDDLMTLPTIQKAAEEVNLFIDTKGIGLLTGPSGCGKSSLIRRTASLLNKGLYKPFYVSHTSLSVAEFFQTLAATLGISPRGRRNTNLRNIKDFIVKLNDQQRIHPVIFIDEAHSLSSDTLKEIRMLTNFDYDSKNACTILLCGHSDLRTKLKLNVFTSLSNSITYSILLDTLPAEETFAYIESRISAVGGKSSLFTKSALKLIHDISGGVLRTSGNAAWRSMIKAFQLQARQVEKEHVQMVTRN